MKTTTEEQQRIDDAHQRVQAAQEEAKNAADLVEALREQVRAGQDVNPADIRSASDVAEHAALRQTAAARQADAVEAEIRKTKIHTLSVELAAFNSNTDLLVDLLKQAEEALDRFAQAAGERTEAIKLFQARMSDLGIPKRTTSIPGSRGPAEHAGMFWGATMRGPGIGINDQVLTPVDAGAFLAAVLYEVAARHKLNNASGRSLTVELHHFRDPASGAAIRPCDFLRKVA